MNTDNTAGSASVGTGPACGDRRRGGTLARPCTDERFSLRLFAACFADPLHNPCSQGLSGSAFR